MKNISMPILGSIAILLLLFSFSNMGLLDVDYDDQQSITGYIVGKQEGKLLFSNEEETQTVTGRIHHSALWITHDQAHTFDIGQKVRIWEHADIFSEEAQKSMVASIERIDDPKPSGADLTAEEAIRQVLEQNFPNNSKPIGINKVTYNAQSDSWTVILNLNGPTQSFTTQDN